MDWSRFYFWALQLIFKFFKCHFPVTTLWLDLFSGAYLNKAQSENSSISEADQIRCFFAWKWLPKRCASLENQPMEKDLKKKTVSVNLSHALFYPLHFLALQEGSNMLSRNVRNYHSMLCNISDNREHTWWFDDAGLGFAPDGAVWHFICEFTMISHIWWPKLSKTPCLAQIWYLVSFMGSCDGKHCPTLYLWKAFSSLTFIVLLSLLYSNKHWHLPALQLFWIHH